MKQDDTGSLYDRWRREESLPIRETAGGVASASALGRSDDPGRDESAAFHAAYRDLEARMRALAESDGDVYIPSPKPEGPADYVLICMEPSMGPRSADEARAWVEKGFRNFLNSIEDFILHFCAQRYLCTPEQRYHVTDFSKGAMPVERARVDRERRYDRWYGLLCEEIELCGSVDAGIVGVGAVVARHLERRRFPRPVTRVIHYSGQAARARRDGVAGREEEFREFRDTVSLEDLLAAAESTLKVAELPVAVRERTLSRLSKVQLTDSRKQLMFVYKLAFESLRMKASRAYSVGPGRAAIA